MTQIHAQKTSQTRSEDPAPPVEPIAQPEAQKLSADIDDLLDEIDAVLEANAEEFVAAFVQKGGE